MDILTLGFAFAVVVLLDAVSLKSRSMLGFLSAGLLVMFTLANVAADNVVKDQGASTPFSLAAGTNDFNLFLGSLAVLAIIQFALVIERQMSRGAQF